MKYDFGLIFKESREGAGLTQEKAAELLRKSTKSISDYECNKTDPPIDVIVKMSKVYQDDHLLPRLGNPNLAKVDRINPSQCILGMFDVTNQFNTLAPGLVSVAKDDRIDKQELHIWSKGLELGEEMIALGMIMKSIKIEKDKKIAAL